MNSLFLLCHELFTWCEAQAIAITLARPKFTPEDFVSGDLDIIASEQYTYTIIQWLKSSGYVITCQYERQDGITCHLYDKKNDCYFHIDFISKLSLKGIPYLSLSETLNRSYKREGLYYPDDIDQLIILIMTHGLKHGSSDKLKKYYPYLAKIIRQSPVATLERLQHVLGDKGTAIYDAILTDKAISPSYIDLLMASWKTYGMATFGMYVKHHLDELFLRYNMPVIRIAFLGVDGAGKSTLINGVKSKMADAFPVIKHTRFIPAWPWNNEQDSSKILSDPHKHANRGYFMSIIKLFYYAVRYWGILVFPRKQPILYLHDRYITDIIVDPKRYRYAGPGLINFLPFFPAPKAYILNDISQENAWQRKQETSPEELNRQINGYRKLSHTLPDFYAVDGSNAIDDNIRQAEKIILQAIRQP